MLAVDGFEDLWVTIYDYAPAKKNSRALGSCSGKVLCFLLRLDVSFILLFDVTCCLVLPLAKVLVVLDVMVVNVELHYKN